MSTHFICSSPKKPRNIRAQLGTSMLEFSLAFFILAGIILSVLGAWWGSRLQYDLQEKAELLLKRYQAAPLSINFSEASSTVSLERDRLNEALNAMLSGEEAQEIMKKKRYYLEAQWQAFTVIETADGSFSATSFHDENKLVKNNFLPSANLVNKTNLSTIIKSRSQNPEELATLLRPLGLEGRGQHIPIVVFVGVRIFTGLEDSLSSSLWRTIAGDDVTYGVTAAPLRGEIE